MWDQRTCSPSLAFPPSGSDEDHFWLLVDGFLKLIQIFAVLLPQYSCVLVVPKSLCRTFQNPSTTSPLPAWFEGESLAFRSSELLPELFAFSVAVLHGQQFLPPVLCRTGHHKNKIVGFLHPTHWSPFLGVPRTMENRGEVFRRDRIFGKN